MVTPRPHNHNPPPPFNVLPQGGGDFDAGDSSRLLRELQDVRSAVDEKMGASELKLFGGRKAGKKGVSGEEASIAAARAAAAAEADDGSDGSEEESSEGKEGEESSGEEGSEESSEEGSDGSSDGGAMSVDEDDGGGLKKRKNIKIPREERVAVSPGGSGGGRTRRRALFDDDNVTGRGEEGRDEEGVFGSALLALYGKFQSLLIVRESSLVSLFSVSLSLFCFSSFFP